MTFLGDEDIRNYFLHLINVRQASRSTVRQYLSGIKFFYETTLGRPLPVLDLIKPRNRSKLRQVQWVLSAEEPESTSHPEPTPEHDETEKPIPCPVCETGLMLVVILIPRATRGPP